MARGFVRDTMEQWARWRVDRESGAQGWPRRTVIGRAIDGMPSTCCTVCRGAGRVHGRRVGAWAAWVVCPQCSGRGRITMNPSQKKANPAFIRSTAPRLVGASPVCERVDRIVAGLGRDAMTRRLYDVLMQEYTRSGTQEQKAGRLHISRGYYSSILWHAHGVVEKELGALDK